MAGHDRVTGVRWNGDGGLESDLVTSDLGLDSGGPEAHWPVLVLWSVGRTILLLSRLRHRRYQILMEINYGF